MKTINWDKTCLVRYGKGNKLKKVLNGHDWLSICYIKQWTPKSIINNSKNTLISHQKYWASDPHYSTQYLFGEQLEL